MNLKNMKIRLPMYFIGLFIMTIGIALSVKSNLGVSPRKLNPIHNDLHMGHRNGQGNNHIPHCSCVHSVFVTSQKL